MNEDLENKHLYSYLWIQGELSFKLDELQRRIDDTVRSNYSRTKQICVLSSRQIGKSYWALTFALSYLLRNPGSIVRLLAPTNKKAYEVIEDNLYPIIADCPQGLITGDRSRLRWNFSNGSSLRIGALERQYVDANRSGNAKLVIYEECGFVRGDEFNYARRSVLGPQLIRSNGHEIFVSSPSEDPEHPLHNEIMPTCDILGTLFRYTVYDSPSLTQSQIDQAAERSGGYESDDFKREYLAQIVRSTTLMVVPKIDERLTFGNWEIPRGFEHRLCLTADWGGVRDKTVCLLHWYEPRTDLYFFIDELVYGPNTTTNVIGEDMKRWIKQYNLKCVFADVPGQLKIDLASMFNLDVQIPPKNDWLSGVNTMAAKFALNKVRVDNKCVFLRKSILGGMFNKTRSDFERSIDLGHMDGCAAAMYAFRTAQLAPDYTFLPDTKQQQAMQKIAAPFKTFGNFRK
jgi:hypothetical protein